MWKTGTDIELYPHCTKEELILEYHLIAQKALEKFDDSYKGTDLEICSKFRQGMFKDMI